MEERDHGIIYVPSWHLPEGSEENYTKTSVIIVNIPTKIQTKHLLNTRQNHHHLSQPAQSLFVIHSSSPIPYLTHIQQLTEHHKKSQKPPPEHL